MRGIATLFICFLAMCVVGCDPIAIKRVAVQFPPAPVQSEVRINLDQPQVKEALGLIDKVLVAHGFERAQAINETNLEAGYRFRPDPNKVGISCYVSLKPEAIDVVFNERGRFATSKEVKQTCVLLRDELGGRFGKEWVR